MQEKIDYRLIRNFTEGKYSFRDFKRIVSWFEDLSLRSEIEMVLKQHWDDFKVVKDEPDKDLNAVYEKLRQQILLEQPGNLSWYKRIIHTYSKVAAILLLPLLVYSSYSLINKFNPNETAWAEIYSPHGARTQFFLPDGSKGWLNSNTKLKYPLDFKRNRHLELSGEAYFEVAHNKDLPFVVSTRNLDVKAVGTVFNVSALEEENMTEVILEEGRVVVESPGIKLKAEMKPDQKFVYNNASKAYQTIALSARQYNAWKEGLLVFRNEPLSEVFKRLSRWYNVKIISKDEQINRYKYRATFREEPIEEVIRLISLTVPIVYKIEKRTQEDQDVYAIREIQIRKK